MDPYEISCLNALQETVVQQRAASLQREVIRLAKQRAFLREERRKARLDEAGIQVENARVAHIEKADWWPATQLAAAGKPEKRLRLRVGGQDFELSLQLLCQDNQSLLYALCQKDSPATTGADGAVADTVVVDRDWWMFRFVAIFLRDGLVPEVTISSQYIRTADQLIIHRIAGQPCSFIAR